MSIIINGVTSSYYEAVVGNNVHLDVGIDPVGTTFQWTAPTGSQPSGSVYDGLSDPTDKDPTITLRKEGSYLVLVTTSGSNVFTGSCVLAARTQRSDIRAPAAAEKIQQSGTFGWARAMQQQSDVLDQLVGDETFVVGRAKTDLRRGMLVRPTSSLRVQPGLPGERRIMEFVRVNGEATGSLRGPLFIVEGGFLTGSNLKVSGSVGENPSSGSFFIARKSGPFGPITGTQAVGAPIYPRSDGEVTVDVETVDRRIGYVLDSDGASHFIYFDGAPGGLQFTDPAAVTETDFAFARLTANQTFVSGNVVLFDLIDPLSTLSGSSGTFTLQPGKTYRLEAAVAATAGAAHFTACRWRNITTGEDIGNIGQVASPTLSSNFAPQPQCTAFVRATASIQVAVRFHSSTGVSEAASATQSWLTIVEIPDFHVSQMTGTFGDYLWATATTHTPVSGNDIQFDRIVISNNLSGSSGTFTLNPNKVYELASSVRLGSTGTGAHVHWVWRDKTANVDFRGFGLSVSSTSTSNTTDGPSTLSNLVRTTASMDVSVRVLATNGTGLSVTPESSFVLIKEIVSAGSGSTGGGGGSTTFKTANTGTLVDTEVAVLNMSGAGGIVTSLSVANSTASFVISGTQNETIFAINEPLEFIDRIIVTSNTGSVSFGQNGHGQFQFALDGDVDEEYICRVKLIQNATGTMSYALRPNGATSNFDVETQGSAGGVSAPSQATILFLGGNQTGNQMSVGEFRLVARTGSARFFQDVGANMSGSTTLLSTTIGGFWFDTTTKITSLEIAGQLGTVPSATVANSIGSGSTFELFRRRSVRSVPTTSLSIDYLYARMNSDRVGVSGNVLLFDNIEIMNGISGSSGTFTLTGGKTYLLEANVANIGSATAIEYRWNNETSNFNLGNIGRNAAVNTASTVGHVTTALAIVRLTASTNFAVRTTSLVATTPTVDRRYSYLRIMEIPETAVFTITGSKGDFLYAQLNAAGTPFVSGSRINFDRIITRSNISGTAGAFTLSPGRAYELSAGIRVTSAQAGTYAHWVWRNETTNQDISTAGLTISPTSTNTFGDGVDSVSTIVDYTSSVVVSTRWVSNNGSTDITASSYESWLTIKEIGSSVNIYLTGSAGTGIPYTLVQTVSTGSHTASFSTLIPVDPTSGSITIYLPAVQASNVDKWIGIKNIRNLATAINVIASGSNTIDQSGSYVMIVPYESITLVSDGQSNYHLI